MFTPSKKMSIAIRKHGTLAVHKLPNFRHSYEHVDEQLIVRLMVERDDAVQRLASTSNSPLVQQAASECGIEPFSVIVL